VRSTLHVFDVDHTITYGSTGRRFAGAAARKGVFKLRYLALIPYSYAIYRFGGGANALFESDFPAIKGVERSLLEEISREVFARRTAKALRPGILKLIEAIKAEGGKVIFATSSLDFIVRPLAERLGVDDVLASTLEYEDGACTGRLEGSAMFGKAKRDAVLDYARKKGIAPADCAFYSDSIHDLPLLLAVGEPVAVAPEPRLRREAEARGWNILEQR
jgi:HAD superfamily hydrolase (TIGR01490 family)